MFKTIYTKSYTVNDKFLELGDNLLVNENIESILRIIKPLNCILNLDFEEDKQVTNQFLMYFLSVMDILLINI